MSRLFSVIAVAGAIVFGAASAFAQSSTFETNVDRPGSDYRSFSLPPGSPPEACQSACLSEPSCRAWTFVQGYSPGCWLKPVVPQAQGNPCCTSGVIRRFN
jgi:hypothetical protein